MPDNTLPQNDTIGFLMFLLGTFAFAYFGYSLLKDKIRQWRGPKVTDPPPPVQDTQAWFKPAPRPETELVSSAADGGSNVAIQEPPVFYNRQLVQDNSRAPFVAAPPN